MQIWWGETPYVITTLLCLRCYGYGAVPVVCLRNLPFTIDNRAMCNQPYCKGFAHFNRAKLYLTPHSSDLASPCSYGICRFRAKFRNSPYMIKPQGCHGYFVELAIPRWSLNHGMTALMANACIPVSCARNYSSLQTRSTSAKEKNIDELHVCSYKLCPKDITLQARSYCAIARY